MVISNSSLVCIQRSFGFPVLSGHLFQNSSHAVHISKMKTMRIWKVSFNRAIVSTFDFFNLAKFYSIALFGQDVHFLIYMATHCTVWKHIISMCSLAVYFFFLLRMKQTPFLLHFPCLRTLNTPPIFLSALPAPLILQRCMCNCFHKTSNNLRSI